MPILFASWTWLLFLYDLFPLDYWITFAPPTIVILLVVIYRLIFNRPLWTEIASLVFFIAVGILCAVIEVDPIVKWGSTIALLFMRLMWLGSMVPPFKLPLTVEYSKWRFIEGLWTNSMFIQPNMAICLVWGWQFVISATLAMVGKTVVWLFLPLLGVRLLTLVPAFGRPPCIKGSAYTPLPRYRQNDALPAGLGLPRPGTGYITADRVICCAQLGLIAP